MVQEAASEYRVALSGQLGSSDAEVHWLSPFFDGGEGAFEIQLYVGHEACGGVERVVCW